MEGRMNYLDELANRIADINRANGWYEDSRRFGEDVALIHSEVSEALEEYRRGNLLGWYRNANDLEVIAEGANYEGFKPEGVPSELADIIIRVLDTCHRYGVDITGEIEAKLAYNATRGYRHGGKVL